MANVNVASISDPTKLTAQQALEFAEAMGSRGLYNPTTARLFKTALQRFVEIMADDEAKTAQAILDGLDGLCDRWARLNNADPKTAVQYKHRARLLLTDFLGYVQDPTSFKGRGHGADGGKKRSAAPDDAKSAAKTASKATKAEPKSDVPPPPRPPSGQVLRSYPLSNDRELEYRLPVGGIAFTDVAKFALHLLTLATDFDPAVPEQAQMFAVVKRRPAAD